MKNERLLSSLTPEFDVMSFGTIFPLTQIRGSAYVEYYGYGTISASTSANPALNDLSIIFDRDVSNNIIGRYTSSMYKERTYSAMYWGYPSG